MGYKRQIDAENALKKALTQITSEETAALFLDAIVELVESVKDDLVDRMNNAGSYSD